MSKNLKLLIVTLLTLFLLSEFTLRKLLHIYPGQRYYSPYFTLVDTLIIKQGFETDSLGIMKVGKYSSRVVNQRIEHFYETGERIEIADTESQNVYLLVNFAAEYVKPDFNCAL